MTELQFIVNRPAANVSYYTPVQSPPAGTIKAEDGYELPKIFTPLKIRGVEFQNRIFVSPMCQYSAPDGHHTDWHFAHLGGILTRGPGLTIVEGTAVTRNGRITPEDSGLWQDSQIAPLKRIVDFAHSQNQKIGLQLAHAGRKGSTLAPWLHAGGGASLLANGWPDDVVAPSDKPYNELFPVPKALSKEGIKDIVVAFVRAAERALRAGFDIIEIHGAHGYLIHNFLSPASNFRTDEYGGSFENRIRFPLEVVDGIRAVIPSEMPLFFRVSATDWLEEVHPNMPSWRSEDTLKLAEILATRGVDFLDVSSGGNHPEQKIKGGPAYQAPFAAQVKKKLGSKIFVGSVGVITDGKLAESILQDGKADAVLVARQFLRRPGLVWDWADELGVKIKVANQIEWGFAGRGPGGKKGGHGHDLQKRTKHCDKV